MAVFDNEFERWGEVDVPYLPSQLIGSDCNEERAKNAEVIIALKKELTPTRIW
ncbi:hypothetical protein J6590_088457 [Homalodisca vitripennis]|nr:hypothetical protein J6590_088457 [Homalodisca vitripennis]